MATSAAIFEELLVRGLFFAAFLSFFRQSKYSLEWTGLAQALVFGLAHFYKLNQQGLVEISQQVFYASVFALIFAVIRIRFNQLWLVIVLHFFVDFQPRIVADQALKPAAWPQILISFTPMALIALWTLMKMDRDRRQGSSTLD